MFQDCHDQPGRQGMPPPPQWRESYGVCIRRSRGRPRPLFSSGRARKASEASMGVRNVRWSRRRLVRAAAVASGLAVVRGEDDDVELQQLPARARGRGGLVPSRLLPAFVRTSCCRWLLVLLTADSAGPCHGWSSSSVRCELCSVVGSGMCWPQGASTKGGRVPAVLRRFHASLSVGWAE